ncbi:MAG: cyclic nucleotide-binding domain-containing protein [Verrucomicrobiota bacterium]|jgi:CRP-like cAMP-binding protein
MNESATLTRKPRLDFTAETLPDHPLFAGLAIQYRQILAECAMRADFEAGDKVVEAGQPASCIYLVINGSIDLETPEFEAPARVQTIGGGDILGWSWLFPPYYWHFNAVAREPTRTMFFYGSRLSQQCDRNHEFGYELIKGMSQILIAHLQADRERWIEAAQVAPAGAAAMADYLVI